MFTSPGEFCIGIPVKVGRSNFRLSGTPIVSISTCQPPSKLGPGPTFDAVMIVGVNLHDSLLSTAAVLSLLVNHLDIY